ncbi:hypothetical protein Ga0080559_TMP201 (plasmid) [Salipiger profundus]|uniref:Thioesterase domain-containing protein n=1 Tax=Salipiger profundus TaxID=1229727 RepID=A0A1U7DDC4_9RHOB|nr:hypothetical protein Ga0080559_TMP201 [Salipiger profundus]
MAEALTSRRSTRAFLDRPVPRAQITRILSLAAQAPSGNNTQPWQVNVLTGAALERLASALLAERRDGAPLPPPEYDYYPAEWPEPHLSRRRENGWALYSLIGVQRGDRAGAVAHHDRNFTFFGAPVGLILSIDRRLGQGALIDVGIFLQSLTLAARAEGLGTCLQAAFAPHHRTIRASLLMEAHQMVICGIALGHPDPESEINRLTPPREPVEVFTRFNETDMDSLTNPLLNDLGITLSQWEEGQAEFRLMLCPRHLNRHGQLQGGVIATLLDVACGYAGIEPGSRASAVTITLNISYVAGVSEGEIIARGAVSGGGRRIYFSGGELRAPDGRLLATAQGSFKRVGEAR